MSKKMTIKDIALEAGVSFKTVSRVINEEKSVKKETREKVIEILKKYNFNVSYNARRLSNSKTNQILLISNILHSELPLQKNSLVVESVVKNARERGYNVILSNSIEELDKTVYGTVEKGYFDGVIILNPKNFEFLEELKVQNIPFVISGVNSKYKFVGTNQLDGSYLATKHLLDIGCRKIHLLMDDISSYTNLEKIKGYKKALEEYNIEYNEENITYNIFKSNQVEEVIKKAYADNKLPDGYMINSDYTSLGAIRAINYLKIDVPKDLKIISFGDTYICTEVYPKITAVKQDFNLIGKYLVDSLIGKIEFDKSIETIIVEAKLEIRESTIKSN